jgi:hypothetical protein
VKEASKKEYILCYFIPKNVRKCDLYINGKTVSVFLGIRERRRARVVISWGQ